MAREPFNGKRVDMILEGVRLELEMAVTTHDSMNSDHEAYAVILEELDEYWEEVRKKRCDRSDENIIKELGQTAAMCIRAIHDLHC
jgi:hypothetical protein